MFGFLFRKIGVANEGQDDVLPFKLKSLYDGDRGTTDLYANDAQLRVWVPEPLSVAMKEVADRLDRPLAKYLREQLVVYLYGSHELLCMHDNNIGIFHPPPPSKPDSGTRFSRAHAVDYIPGLGKNIVPLKLFLHEKMKADLQGLADKAGIPLSQFVREALVSHFLGHTVWPERNQLWSREQQEIADGWVSGSIEEGRVVAPTPEEEDALEGRVEILRW